MADPSLRGANVLAVQWEEAMDALRDIRTQVFIEEQNVPVQDEWDALDNVSWHYLARDELGVPAGCVRVTPEGQVTRLAVLKNHRRRGIAKDLMERAIKDASERRFDELFLHAQLPVIGFYEAFGFSVKGPVFSDAGILHRAMTLALNARPSSLARAPTSVLIRDPNLIVEEISSELFRSTWERISGDAVVGADQGQGQNHIEYFSATAGQEVIGLAALINSQWIEHFLTRAQHHPSVVLTLIDALKSKAARYRSSSLSIRKGLLPKKMLAELGFASKGRYFQVLLPRLEDTRSGALIEDIDIEQAELGTTNKRYPFRTFAQCRTLTDHLTSQSLRRIRIWSPQLDHDLYSRLDLVQYCSKLARKNAHTRIEILIHHSDSLVQKGHHLLELSRRLPSRIKIKRADEEERQGRQELLLVDDRGLLTRPTDEHYQGWANFNDIAASRRLHKLFDRAWRTASEDTRLRVLNL